LRLAHAAGSQIFQFPGNQRTKPIQRVGTRQIALHQVRNIEQANAGADMIMFRDNAFRILHRHFKTGEGDHPGAAGPMDIIKGCSLERAALWTIRHKDETNGPAESQK